MINIFKEVNGGGNTTRLNTTALLGNFTITTQSKLPLCTSSPLHLHPHIASDKWRNQKALPSLIWIWSSSMRQKYTAMQVLNRKVLESKQRVLYISKFLFRSTKKRLIFQQYYISQFRVQGKKCTVFSILCRSVSKCICVCMCTNKHISVFDVPATAGTFRGSWKRSLLKHPRSCSVSALNNPFCLQLWQAAGTPLWALSSLYLQLTAYYFFG